MADINSVIICGRLGRDPEMKTLQNGQNLCSATVATSEKFKKGEEWQERTEWHSVTAWGYQAEALAKAFKGAIVTIQGKLQTRSWEGQDGKKNFKTEIVAERIQVAAGKASQERREESQGSEGSDTDVPF